MGNQKYISTTALSKLLHVSTSDLFSLRGTWVVWPDTIIRELELMISSKTTDTKYLNATVLSQILKVSKLRINPILSELGWLERDRKGWVLTNLGENISGKQLEYEKTGIPYVTWPESILNNKSLIETFKQINGGILRWEKVTH
ncbi:hypothetical protein [Brevibacillus formosus]|uniref:hypothetical protein n=1 Tax=Brevibacillus formosus TaxID=54913 RepID=UPI002155E554|nr:hypothetical protein [Brevibacillus formosus]